MVALLVGLKLTLLRNSLRRSVWRTVGLVLGLLYALGIVVASVAGLVALRWTSTALTGDVTVVVFSMLTLGWLILSLLVFGVDETVDPSKFALLPVRARDLLPGLFVAGLIGSPGVATLLVSAGLVVAWARDVPLTVAALVACPIGAATCFLLSRAATTAFAAFLASRRFRDLAFVLLALAGAGLGIGGNVLSGVAASAGGHARALLSTAAGFLGWTPFGWAWSVPADLARGNVGIAAGHLVLALGLAGALWWAWGYFLARRLVEPVEPGTARTSIKRGTLVERLYPHTPAGAVAERTLHYWRRDPRYLAALAQLLIAPVVLLVTQLLNTDGMSVLAVFAPTVLALLTGVGLAADVSYDGSALWLHISAGVAGAADRTGRVLSTATVFAPILVVLLVVSFGLTGQWQLLAPVVALTVAWALIGLGVGCWVGALWQWPAAPPGANPFQRGNSGGLPGLLSFSVTLSLTLVLGLPTLALVIAAYWHGWLGYVALAVGVASGWLVLRLGIRHGGRVLERRWPEVLGSVGEQVA